MEHHMDVLQIPADSCGLAASHCALDSDGLIEPSVSQELRSVYQWFAVGVAHPQQQVQFNDKEQLMNAPKAFVKSGFCPTFNDTVYRRRCI